LPRLGAEVGEVVEGAAAEVADFTEGIDIEAALAAPLR
jgi:hypothetical protein